MKRMQKIVIAAYMATNFLNYGMVCDEYGHLDDLHVQQGHRCNETENSPVPDRQAEKTLLGIIQRQAGSFYGNDLRAIPTELREVMMQLAEKHRGMPVIVDTCSTGKLEILQVRAERGNGYHLAIGRIDPDQCRQLVRQLRLVTLVANAGYNPRKGLFDHGDLTDDGSEYELGEPDGLPVVQRKDGYVPDCYY